MTPYRTSAREFEPVRRTSTVRRIWTRVKRRWALFAGGSFLRRYARCPDCRGLIQRGRWDRYADVIDVHVAFACQMHVWRARVRSEMRERGYTGYEEPLPVPPAPRPESKPG